MRPTTFEAYLDEVYPLEDVNSQAVRKAKTKARAIRLTQFPFSVILAIEYPRMDFANRWCWQQFGPANGQCLERGSEYPACHDASDHAHLGRWQSCWLEKTDYDVGFNEWLFSKEADYKHFLDFIPHISWGENYESPL